MKAILISNHAKWCALMMNGDKTIEVRKGTALYKAIQKLIDENGYADIYVYCTKGDYDIIRESSPYSSVPHYTCVKINKKLTKDLPEYVYSSIGKVIFKFRCYKVEEILPLEEYESPFGMAYKLTKDKIVCCQKAQLTYDEYNHYLKGKKGCAIHINDLEIFDKPKELSEFRKVMSEYNHWLLCADCPRYWEDESETPIEPRCELNWKDCDKDRLTKAPQSWCYVEIGE